ncbi:MAG: hypothetical protein AAB629_01315 [Patescibacteria group bacterium]
MKRTLAQEALYRPGNPKIDRDSKQLNASFERAATRIRRIDPLGFKGLALLKEIEEQRLRTEKQSESH